MERAKLPPTAPVSSDPRRSTRTTTLSAIGSIIAAVAVLETNMLSTAVASMIPATMFAGRVPTRRRVISAMRRSSPQRCMASASRKPPRNRKMSLSA